MKQLTNLNNQYFAYGGEPRFFKDLIPKRPCNGGMFDVFCEAIGFFDFLFFALAISVFLIILVVVGTIIGGLALIYFGLPALLGDANFLSLPSL